MGNAKDRVIKKIGDFLMDESGFVSRDSLVRSGIKGMAILSAVSLVSTLEASAHCNHTSSHGSVHTSGMAGCSWHHVNKNVTHSSYCTY